MDGLPWISLKRIIVSTLALITALILVQLFMQAMVFGMAHLMGYEPTFSFSRVTTITDYHKWTRLHVLQVSFLPPFICLFLGLYIYQYMRKQNRAWGGGMQFFWFWLMVCLINIFFSHLLFSPLGVTDPNSPFYQTLAIVMVWFFIPPVLSLVFMVAGIFMTIMAGYLLSAETVKLSHSYRLAAENSGKNIIIVQMYLLPVLLASIPFVLLGRGGYFLPLLVSFVNLALYPVGMFLRSWLGPYPVDFEKAEVGVSFPIILFFVTGVFWSVTYLYWR